MTSIVAARTDEDIQREVQLELKWDARVNLNEVGVAVNNGVVTLGGWVDRFSKKWAAERAALRVRGVRAVVNEIEARLDSANQLTDVGIAEAGGRALGAGFPGARRRRQVTVSGGWIRLRGEVDWEYQRREAECVVRNLVGVKGVTHFITRRPRRNPSPDDLRSRLVDLPIDTPSEWLLRWRGADARSAPNRLSFTRQ